MPALRGLRRGVQLLETRAVTLTERTTLTPTLSQRERVDRRLSLWERPTEAKRGRVRAAR